MLRTTLFLTLLAFTACPHGFPVRDAGPTGGFGGFGGDGGGGGFVVLGGGAGGGFGGGPDTSFCAPASQFPVSFALVDQEFTHFLLSCFGQRPTAVRITGPAPVVGASTTAVDFMVQVAFTAQQPGRYRVELDFPSGQRSARDILVVRPETLTQQTQRFVDRMDLCDEGPYRSRTGLTFCGVARTVYAYGADGNLATSFAGQHLRVRGDEVWTVSDLGAGPMVEHRSALDDGGLQFDGRGAIAVQSGSWGDVRPGAMMMMGSTRLVLTTFDGGAVESIETRFPVPLNSPLAFLEDTAVIDSSGCSVTPGCTARPDCQPVAACALELDGGPAPINWSYFTWSDAAIFGGAQQENPIFNQVVLETVQIDYLPRPITPRRPLAFRYEAAPGTRWLRRAPGLDRPALSILGNVLLTPHVLEDAGLDFSAARTLGTPVTVTDDWLLSSPDPFTLAFGPPPQ
ncbi:MAG: hypothetical protein U0228_39485 [Myxococcaceae bacterium]